jgi:hypothetical protein
MKAKIKKGILIGMGIIMLLMISYVVGWPIERVRLIGVIDLDEYKDYYIAAKHKSVWAIITGSAGVTDVYFLPGQKKRMLEKIKEDVIYYLEKLIEEHGDVFYKYEISDDLWSVRIYETLGEIDGDKRRNLGPKVNSRIGFLTILYHGISGIERPVGTDQALEFIEPGE